MTGADRRGPPTVAGWNLALRFGLELGALAGLGVGAWTLASGAARPLAAALVPLLAAIAWGVFNVRHDPSRSGRAPVEVPGRVRLALEVAVLVAGAAAFILADRTPIGLVLAALVMLHYATSWPRVRWLLRS